jgi:hypothetical protein
LISVRSGPFDDVIHARCHQQSAASGRVGEDDARVVLEEVLGVQRRFEHRGGARVFLRLAAGLVRDQLRLYDQAQSPAERLDLVEDRRRRALHQGDEPCRCDAHRCARGRSPLGAAAQEAGAEIELALVREQLAVADVERLVVDEQADDLAVGDVDDRLPQLRVAVAPLA